MKSGSNGISNQYNRTLCFNSCYQANISRHYICERFAKVFKMPLAADFIHKLKSNKVFIFAFTIVS
jgi:hypothetical protein